MASVSPPHQRPRGPTNELHKAAFYGSTERLVALLSDGSIDVNQGEPHAGYTPLMAAAGKGRSRAVRILLDKGADASIVADNGFTALHCSAQGGHLTISKMLMEAGADLEAAGSHGITPLHLAAETGHSEVMSVLIEAGANPDIRGLGGATPLFAAAQEGHKDAIKVLLRAKADPLLTRKEESGALDVALDMAAQNGHLEVVCELLQQVRIAGCGGATRGVRALRLAAMNQHLDIMTVLADAGVVDDCTALAGATAYGSELSVKLLLQQRRNDEAAYVNHRDMHGVSPLLCAMGYVGISSPSPRITRLLVDAGADTTSVVRVTNTEGTVKVHGTPLYLATHMLREKKVAGKAATEKQLHRLEGIRRLLLRVEAVHAVSLLWPVDIPSIVDTAEGTGRKVATSPPLRRMLPILRRRAGRPRVLLGALFRSSGKP